MMSHDVASCVVMCNMFLAHPKSPFKVTQQNIRVTHNPARYAVFRFLVEDSEEVIREVEGVEPVLLAQYRDYRQGSPVQSLSEHLPEEHTVLVGGRGGGGGVIFSVAL